MDAGSAAKAFDAGGAGGHIRPALRLRIVPAAVAEAARHPVHAPSGAAPDRSSDRYGAGRRTNWAAIGTIAGFHAALLVGLVSMDVVSLKPVPEPMMVSLVPAAATPPPPPPAPDFAPPLEVTPPVIVPPAIDILPPQPSPVQAVVSDAPPPVRTVVTAQPAPAPVTQGSPSMAADLATTMISATPPKYPVESRRRKEEGTVTLLVTVSPEGDVAAIEVSRSSGFARLDKAALAAVKTWRWSPVLRGGIAVPVRGIVEIPFILKKP